VNSRSLRRFEQTFCTINRLHVHSESYHCPNQDGTVPSMSRTKPQDIPRLLAAIVGSRTRMEPRRIDWGTSFVVNSLQMMRFAFEALRIHSPSTNTAFHTQVKLREASGSFLIELSIEGMSYRGLWMLVESILHRRSGRPASSCNFLPLCDSYTKKPSFHSTSIFGSFFSLTCSDLRTIMR
jgi:hypothetical protein